MQVKLLRRWGNHQPGDTVNPEATMGRWLVDHAFGTASGVQAPDQAAFMPGEDGPDPLASGDGTRRGNPAMVKGARRDNNALPVPGSPVQYNVGVAESAGNDSGNGESPDGDQPSEPSSKVSGSGRRRPKA